MSQFTPRDPSTVTDDECRRWLDSGRRIARRYPDMVDDYAATVALLCWEAVIKGYPVAGDTWRHIVSGAWRALVGDRRYGRVQLVFTDRVGEFADASTSRVEERGIAMWRIQRVWPTLTATQQDAVLCVLRDDDFSEAERAGGYGRGVLCGAAKTAFRRIASPKEFSRRATVVDKRAAGLEYAARWRAKNRAKIQASRAKAKASKGVA